MEEAKTTAGQGLGITGLILGIMAIPLAIIGCTFMLALLFGAAGIVLSAVGLAQANKANGTKGLPTAGLVVSITGTAIALMWGLFIATAIQEEAKWWRHGGYSIIERISKDAGEELEDAFKDVEEDIDEMGKDLEEVLEDLEEDFNWEEWEWDETVSEAELEKLLDAYEDLIGDYIKLVEKAEEGDLSALAEYAKISAKAVALAAKITAVAPRLTEEQKQRFEELHKKYEKALEKTE